MLNVIHLVKYYNQFLLWHPHQLTWHRPWILGGPKKRDQNGPDWPKYLFVPIYGPGPVRGGAGPRPDNLPNIFRPVWRCGRGFIYPTDHYKYGGVSL